MARDRRCGGLGPPSSPPLVLGIGTSEALARFEIFHEALPILGDPAGLKIVVDDSVPAFPVDVDVKRMRYKFKAVDGAFDMINTRSLASATALKRSSGWRLAGREPRSQ